MEELRGELRRKEAAVEELQDRLRAGGGGGNGKRSRRDDDDGYEGEFGRCGTATFDGIFVVVFV